MDDKKYTETMEELLEAGVDPDYVCDYIDENGDEVK